MERKAYVIFVGRCPGEYDSWVQCQEQVNGFCSCSYSSYPTWAEAESVWLDWTNSGGRAPRPIVLALAAPNNVVAEENVHGVHHGGHNPVTCRARVINEGRMGGGGGLHDDVGNGIENEGHGNWFAFFCCVALAVVTVYCIFFG
ncbi:Ribosomal protein L9/RNase H1, N-terminal [Sesbania bispinosa]|nr:Ribosomal protein L9/RNase H1, N-terminal [Sesbania bispinosa]